MAKRFEYKQSHQSKAVYTEKGMCGKPYISIIIEKGEFDDITWSYPLSEIVRHYDLMREHFLRWFHDSTCDNTVFYIDKEHKRYITRPTKKYISGHYLWNRLFVEDIEIRNVIDEYKHNNTDNGFVVSYPFGSGDSSIVRTKPVILNSMPSGKRFALLLMRPDEYSSYTYYIHTLFDAPFGTDITPAFFRWLNHMRKKSWFNIDHMNALVKIAQTHWKVPVFALI